MGKSTSRDWTQIYSIYRIGQWQILIFHLCQAILFAILSILYLLYFEPICVFFEGLLSAIVIPVVSGGFTCSFTALSAPCLFFAAANFFYSSVPLHYDIAQCIISSMTDWSSVKLTLDLGCYERGILLNVVAFSSVTDI